MKAALRAAAPTGMACWSRLTYKLAFWSHVQLACLDLSNLLITYVDQEPHPSKYPYPEHKVANARLPTASSYI